METSQNELINIYNILKNEIKEFDSKNSKLLVLSLSAAGFILTFSSNSNFSSENIWILLCPMLFNIPIQSIIYGNRLEIWKTSTYMRVFLEPKLLETKWGNKII